MTLNIALRDGFRDDTVTIRVDGREVYRKSAVTTDLSISFAGSVDVQVASGTARIEVALQRGPRGSEQVQVADTPFLEVRIVDGAVEFRKSKERIPML